MKAQQTSSETLSATAAAESEPLQEAAPDIHSGASGRLTVRLFDGKEKLDLECGRQLGPIDVAYETFGRLSDKRDNAILICHALSGDSHVTSDFDEPDEKGEKTRGWWDIMVGPGKPIDTDKYFVICSNALGGCMGTTGPSSVNPETGKPYGLTFPMITIRDTVDLQQHLVDHLGIEKLLAVVGGSMGGMQTLTWAVRHPDRLAAALPIASTSRLSAQSIAFDAVGRNAILRDENFQKGTYYENGKFPAGGLAVARMIGHITYLSEEAMHTKFGRRLQRAANYQYEFESEFSVETYLDHQGSRFVDRFDANTYLYFSKAMDYYDLAQPSGTLRESLRQAGCRFLVVSFDSDWLFPPVQSREIVDALIANNQDVTYCNIHCPYGHDSFLLESEVQGELIKGFLKKTYERLPERADTSVKAESGERSAVTVRRPKGSIFEGERVDHRFIENLIEPNSSVLDLGCGDGQLMRRLRRQKNIRGMGITLSQKDIIACSQRGVSVVQYDLDNCLSRFGDHSYDTVVLSQTLQVVRHPDAVLREMLRIGRQVIISFPNFAYWRYRLQILLEGRAPMGTALPDTWYHKTAVNYLSIRDFEEFLRNHLYARVVKKICLSSGKGRPIEFMPNWLADEAIFVIAADPDRNPAS